MAHKLGVQSPLDPVPSIGLGSNAVSPLDMASAYATLAAGGIYSEPRAIKRVVLANGKEDEDAGWGKPKRSRVISEGVAYTVTKILEKNVQYGTGTGANYGQPAAGKTGTTEEHSDAWFCGYTPRLETTVWIGYARGKIPMTNVHGIRVAGGTFPAQIWRLFMSSAIGQLEPLSFPEPAEYPEWHSFERGQYGRSFGYSGSYGSSGGYVAPTTETESSDDTTPAPAPATTQPKAPPLTTAAPPPPATTAPPPPPATTEPPPPATTEPPATTGPIQP
jgi:penicillin-binding protein 1A